jgi:CRP-like cAMP-binding protein
MHDQLAKYIRNEIPVTDEQLHTILSCFKSLSVNKNEVLLNEGEVNQRVLFVCKGCLRIYFIQDDGQEATRYLAFEDHFATALVSFISQEPSMEYIQALEPTQLLFITLSDFSHLLDTIPAWERFYRQYLEKAYVTNTNRLMSFITMDAGERYLELLQQKPEIADRLPNKIVASYLNISQETLSRIKGRV